MPIDRVESLEALLARPGTVEEHVLAGPVAVLAIHGGCEGGTGELARLVAERTGASLYVCFQHGPRAHLASHRFDPASSPALRAVLDHADRVLSLHGYGRWVDPDRVLVGGLDRTLATDVAASLSALASDFPAVTDLDQIEEGLRGLHPANPVNLARGGGVQLELPHRARGSSPIQVDGVVPVPHPTVVDALVDVVERWQAAV